MQTGYKTLAGRGWFFRDGADFTSPNAGTAARDAKPGSDDTGWLDLGHIDFNSKPTTEKEEIVRNVPGARMLYDVLHTKKGLTHALTLHELQNIVFELLFGTLDLSGAGQYNPLEGGPVKGWLKLQEYDQNDTLVNTHDGYVYLAPPSDITRDDKHVTCEIEAMLLYSTLNTGTLAANPE